MEQRSQVWYVIQSILLFQYSLHIFTCKRSYIPESIVSIKDAQIILRAFEKECHKCENMLRSALNEAEQQMKQADHWVGKARFIIRKSGFGQILHSSTCKTQPHVLEIWSMFYFLYFILISQYIHRWACRTYTRRKFRCNSGLARTPCTIYPHNPVCNQYISTILYVTSLYHKICCLYN